MATTHDPESFTPSPRSGRSGRVGLRRVRWTSKRYYRLADLGFFRNRRVELVNGEIIEMSAFKPPHAIAIELLDNVIRQAFGRGYRCRIQLPLDLDRRNQPEPDLAVLAGDPRDSADHPTSALLLVEVSDTSLRYDQRVKAALYARAGIADYWIVSLIDRQLEIQRNPGPDPARPGRYRYLQTTIVPADGHATPLAAPRAQIAVADLLP